MKFADIHCHPHSRAFHWMRGSKIELSKKKKHSDYFNPWTIVLSNFKQQKKGKRAFSYSQCDPVKLTNGNTALVYAALYPFEKGFFNGTEELDKEDLVKGLDKVAQWGMRLLPLQWLILGIRTLVNKKSGGKNSLRDYFQAIVMKMPMRRINYITSAEYDYYEELHKERDFLLNATGQQKRNKILITGIRKFFKSKKRVRKNHPESLEATGKYVVCKNYGEVNNAITANNIAMVMTIEGMHALGTDNSLDKISERIQEIKQWDYPIFFITFAHHFNNFLCGHAHSITKVAEWFMSQKDGVNEGFNDVGLKAARELLSLNESLAYVPEELGRRILVDLKHTAAASRKDFYEKIVSKCFENGHVIPVILSHVGYSDVTTLDRHIELQDDEKDDALSDNGFYPWNINACDEDIKWAAKTNGIIGLCLDQRILGAGTKHKTGEDSELVFKNLKAMLDVVLTMESPYKENLWNIFSLGTDFEGYIDPINKYADALDFELLRKDLETYIKETLWTQKEKYYLVEESDIARVANKICFQNAMDFLEKNF